MSLKSAGNGSPSSLTVYELLLRDSEGDSCLPAITYIDDADELSTIRLTRAQFIARLHQMIHFLRALGVGRSDVVSILSPNVPDAMIAFYAAETVGIVNPINFLLRPEEVVAMVQAVKSKILITIGPEAPDLWKTAVHIKEHAPLIEHVVTIGGAGGGRFHF
jgi:acyl-coenzyme A synthetase/AMP-(fatty) acid ligase